MLCVCVRFSSSIFMIRNHCYVNRNVLRGIGSVFVEIKLHDIRIFIFHVSLFHSGLLLCTSGTWIRRSLRQLPFANCRNSATLPNAEPRTLLWGCTHGQRCKDSLSIRIDSKEYPSARVNDKCILWEWRSKRIPMNTDLIDGRYEWFVNNFFSFPQQR